MGTGASQKKGFVVQGFKHETVRGYIVTFGAELFEMPLEDVKISFATIFFNYF